MNSSRQSLGRWGENQAAEFLSGQGYVILERNVRTPHGEIDLVAQQQERGIDSPGVTTVFVEVKTRSSRAFGYPEESVTPRKQAHLLSAAQAYLQDHPELEGDWRIDVIAVQRLQGQRAAKIVHFENAVT